MAPTDIKDKLTRLPFQPIRVHISDGSSYEIHEMGTAYITRMEMGIGIEPDDSGMPTRTVYVDPRHVTRIEPLGNGEDGLNGVRR